MVRKSEQLGQVSSGDFEQFDSEKQIERDVKSESVGVVETSTGLEFKVWKDADGNLCIGNECFSLRPDFKDGSIIAEFDTDNPKCPVSLKEASEILKELVFEGAPTIYRKRRSRNA